MQDVGLCAGSPLLGDLDPEFHVDPARIDRGGHLDGVIGLRFRTWTRDIVVGCFILIS